MFAKWSRVRGDEKAVKTDDMCTGMRKSFIGIACEFRERREDTTSNGMTEEGSFDWIAQFVFTWFLRIFQF